MTIPLRKGFSVRIFLPDGDPTGIKVIEKSNWIGVGIEVPRALFGQAKSRREFEKAGVYFLIGESQTGQLPKIYIGEGDPIRPRLDQHSREKDFWTHAVAFVSKDQNLNKAHVQRLEARLVELAKDAKRCELENGNIPKAPSLSEADVAEIEGFLDDILLCLPTLGYTFFEKPLGTTLTNGQSAPQNILFLNARGIEATGADTPQGFVVYQGAHASKSETPSMHAYMREIRSDLMRLGVFKDKGEFYELTQSYTFPSPSTAAGVLLGRATNGRTDWKTKDGKTLKFIQENISE